MQIPEDIDHVDTTKNDYATIPDGQYLCRIHEAKEQMSKTGKQELILQLSIADGGEFENRRVFDRLCWEDGRKKRSKMVLEKLGVKLVAGAQFDPATLVGKMVTVDLRSEVFNNQTQSRPTFDGYLLVASDGDPVVGADDKQTLIF